MKLLIQLLSAAGICVLALIIGCANENKPPQTAPPVNYPQYPATAATSIYVIQQNTTGTLSNILTFAANAQGSVTPTAILNSPANITFNAVAVDTAGNIYVAAAAFAGSPNPAYQILIYAPGASGSATPARTISVPAAIIAIAVDTTGQVYTLSAAGVSVFAATATGSAAPIRKIPSLGAGGAVSTGISSPAALTVDSAQDIFVSTLTNILVFAPTANGDVAPTRNLSWSPSLYGEAIAIAVDIGGRIFATAACSTQVCNGSSSRILQFAVNANGFLIPTLLAVPTSSPSNEVTIATGLAVDGVGNLYTQLATGTAAGVGQVTYINYLWVDVFAANSTTPVQISSSAWTNYAANSLALH